MALLLLEQPLHFYSHYISFLFCLSLSHVLIFFFTQIKLSLYLSPKTSSISFHSSTHHLFKASFPAFPISVYGVTIRTVSQAICNYPQLSLFHISWSPRLVTNWTAYQNYLSIAFLLSALFWFKLWSPLPWTVAIATIYFFLLGILHSTAQLLHHRHHHYYHCQNYLSKIRIWLGRTSAQTSALHCLWVRGQELGSGVALIAFQSNSLFSP